MLTSAVLLRAIECVEAYLMDSFNVVVDFDEFGQNEYWIDDRVITINNSDSPREQLYILLHEAGHVILREKNDFDEICTKIESDRIEVLKEEVFAWEEARKLAKELCIPLDNEWVSNYRKALRKYARWVAVEN